MKLKVFHTLQRMFPFFKLQDHKFSVVIIALLMIIGVAGNLSIPLLFKHIITLLTHHSASLYKFMMLCCVVYGVCWILQYIVKQLQDRALVTIIEGGLRNVTLAAFGHLLTLSVNFHRNRTTGTIIEYINRAHHSLEELTWIFTSFLIPTLIELSIAISLIMYFYGALYGGLLLGISVFYVVLNLLFVQSIKQARAQYNKKSAQAQNQLVDSLLNFETIKCFTNETHEYTTLKRILDERKKIAVDGFKIESSIHALQNVAIGIGLLCITCFSGHAVYHQYMTLADFVLINGYALRFIVPLQQITHAIYRTKKGLENLRKFLTILETKNEVPDAPHAIQLPAQAMEVAFDSVSFGYTPERAILTNLTFTIPAGATVALVGLSGSGKSTIAHLLLRFYRAHTGSIKINGCAIDDFTQESIRKAIGIIPQNTMLFNNTLYYNILYGDLAATESQVYHVAQRAHLDSFIQSLPQHYATMVGEHGVKLSGGEKQRVAIARALLKKPLMYIFDEATSALDSSTEKEIQRNLEEISKGVTTLIITHRLSTIINVDKIVVLDKGTIAEEGDHEQLLHRNGLYARLWEKQHSKH